MTKTSPLCPICRRPLPRDETAARIRPFCSKRCADIDLGRWLKGAYAIPTSETDDKSDEESVGADAEEQAGGEPDRPVRH